jgi:hypothetical protein
LRYLGSRDAQDDPRIALLSSHCSERTPLLEGVESVELAAVERH